MMLRGKQQSIFATLARWAPLYARLALGTAFLSAVASRFGFYHGTPGLKYFPGFVAYTGEVNAFLPRAVIPAVAWCATIAETAFGILLIAGLWLRWVALGSAALLALFATAMAVSLGVKAPMDYSVYSASSAALLLALHCGRAREAHHATVEDSQKRG